MDNIAQLLNNLTDARALSGSVGTVQGGVSPAELRSMAIQCFHHPVDHGYNYEIKNWVSHKLDDPKVIIEAGAADGSDTLLFSTIFHRAKIHSFEPMKEFFPLLVNMKKVLSLDNVELHELALAEENGRRKLYSMNNGQQPWGASTILEPTDLHHELVNTIKIHDVYDINITNLDFFCDAAGISVIDLLWLDMQGMEPQVLKASTVALENTKVLVSEVNFKDIYTDGILYDEFKPFLEEHGFKIEKEYFDDPVQGNIIATNERFS